MADDHGAPARKKLAESTKESPTWHLARTVSTVFIIPSFLFVLGITAWLIVKLVDSVDQRLADHDSEFAEIKRDLGQIVANQSAGQVQRDGQQKQLDGLEDTVGTIRDKQSEAQGQRDVQGQQLSNLQSWIKSLSERLNGKR
jgi:peptidoglycan hydrolase CwlO-like protein